MRIIRLTTEEQTASFDSTFNEDIKFEANTQIALQNVSLEVKKDQIVINGDNDMIRFSIRGIQGLGTKTIYLKHNSDAGGENDDPFYGANNYSKLLKDLQDKMNVSLVEVGAEIGVQFKVAKSQKGEIQIQGVQSDFSSRAVDLIANINTVANVPQLVATGADPQWNSAVAGEVDTNERTTYSTHAMTKGCGVFRTKIRRLMDLNADVVSNGYIQGVSSANISSKLNGEGFLNTDFNYAIGVFKTDENYHYFINGAMTESNVPVGYTGTGAVNNDFVEIVIEGTGTESRIKGKVWKNGAGAGVHNLLFNEPYDQSKQLPLYPFLTFRGGVNDKAQSVRITTDPYFDPPTVNLSTGTNEIEDIVEVGAPSPPQVSYLPTSTFIQFEGIELPKFLGFTETRYPNQGFTLARHFNFVADLKFNITNTADAFMVLLDNIQLKSYDDYDPLGRGKGGRKNILAVVPQSDADELVIYEPNNLVFVDTDFSNSVNMRNIKARIVKNDNSAMEISGLTTMTLIIKNKGE